MAFWGVEVKPGRPFTHSFDNLKGRLRISQATLGIGSTSTVKSLVQCNVGNKVPLLLCALLPDKTESCSLDLEFEEKDDKIVFSVIGPRSVHLIGYYLRNPRSSNINDESESYGEDVGHSGSQQSNRNSDDEYGGSFINDSDPEAYPSSPSTNEVASEDTLEDTKSKHKKNRRHLKKKYQLFDSDNEVSAPKQRNGCIILESEDEDNMPISTLLKSEETKLDNWKNPVNETNQEIKEDGGNEKLVSEPNMENKVATAENSPESQPFKSLDTSNELATSHETGMVPRRKKKQRSKEITTLEEGSLCNINVVEEVKGELDGAPIIMSQQSPSKICDSLVTKRDLSQNLCDLNEGILKLECDQSFKSLKTSNKVTISHVDDITPRKKRKQRSKEENALEECCLGNISDVEKVKSMNDEAPIIMSPQFSSKNQQKQSGEDTTLNNDPNKIARKKSSEEKKVKKKKRSKPLENDDKYNTDDPIFSTKEVERSVMDIEGEEGSLANISQTRTLSNGLTIEEVEMGKTEGKVASKGKRVSVLYIGKLKSNGQIIESSDAPFKFRLGVGKVIQGWDDGISGMRVGGKRRLTIPPSMGYGNEGDNENIPPNAWLVYDVELVAAS